MAYRRYRRLSASAVRADRRKDRSRNPAPKDATELDAIEAREWLDSLDYVLQSGGPVKVARLLRELTLHATESGVKLPFSANTPYINTIRAEDQALMPGSPDLERRIKSVVRWNAAATLYEVGFNHFFRGHESSDADIVLFHEGCRSIRTRR